jgi:hypothetical protein
MEKTSADNEQKAIVEEPTDAETTVAQQDQNTKQEDSNTAVVPVLSSHNKHTTRTDAMREVRSMIVAALPVPPMPIMVSRELADENFAASSTCSSHDLIAHMMNIACTCATEKQNADRALLQTQLQADLFEAVDSWRASEPDPLLVLPPIAWTYRVLGEFTRRYVQSYLPDPAKDQDVRFVPVHEVDRTHAVHRRAVEFQKAQDLLYGKCRMLTVDKKGERYARSYDHMSYAELVQMSVARILDSK